MDPKSCLGYTIIYLASISSSIAIKCYSCDSSKILNCSNDFGKYSIQCPEANKGCLLTVKGSIVKRSCYSLPINDSKVANGIIYNFCNSELCNKENPDKLLQKFSNQIITEDDKRSSSEEIEDQDEEQGEDESSGNGSSELTQNIFTTTPQNPTVRPSNIGHANISNSLLIIMYATTVNILIVKNIFM